MPENKEQEITFNNNLGHRIISIIALVIICFGGLEALAYLTNLYQPKIYIYLSVYIYLFLLLWLQFIFDTHFKSENYVLSLFQSLKHRFQHFLVWKNFRHFHNFMILPGIIYWGSVILIGINLGHVMLQQFLVIVSALALVISLTLFHEVFRKDLNGVQRHHFIILSYIKIYAAWVIYSAALGITWYYCLPANLFYLGIFLATFMLFYQALFQVSEISLRGLLIVFAVALIVAAVSYVVFLRWNVNYFSAGFLLAATYNFLWSLGLHAVRKTLTRNFFFEQLLFYILVLVMVLSVTNFRAQIDRC